MFVSLSKISSILFEDILRNNFLITRPTHRVARLLSQRSACGWAHRLPRRPFSAHNTHLSSQKETYTFVIPSTSTLYVPEHSDFQVDISKINYLRLFFASFAFNFLHHFITSVNFWISNASLALRLRILSGWFLINHLLQSERLRISIFSKLFITSCISS